MTRQIPPLPRVIQTEAELDEVLSRPDPALVDLMKQTPGRLIVLGAGGKMGPTLCCLARRASEMAGTPLDITAVSRFSDPQSREGLERSGVKTVSCDLFDQAALRALPDADHVIYLVGLKFGTRDHPEMTWAVNTLIPARLAEKYPGARIVAVSTGNVYPMSEVARGGSVEGDALTPRGEYANAAVARERIFEFCSRQTGTPITILRLFYAVELRYGVLVDLARHILAQEPIERANGFFNCIWQRDANSLILRSLTLAAAPPSVWNLCRPELFSVRKIAGQLGALLGLEPRFSGEESPTALLGNASRLCARLGTPPTEMDTMLRWTAEWVKKGGRNLGKPTHFEVRDGAY